MTQDNSFRKLITGMGAASVLAGSSLTAGDYGKAVVNDKMPVEEASTFCDFFDLSTLYEADSGFIRGISLNGRYHGQGITQEEDINGIDNNGFNQWQHRRARLGLDIEFANHFKFASSFNVSDGDGSGTGLIRRDFFNDVDEMYIQWAPSKTNYVTVGKQKQLITREFSTSSKKIKTIERSHIVNEVADQKPWGATYGFETGDFDHELGAWVYGTDGTSAQGGFELPRGDSRGGFSYRLAYGITEQTKLHFDYAYTNNSDGRKSPTGSAISNHGSNYQHGLALGTVSDFGRLDLVTDMIFGINREASGATLGSRAIPAGDDTWGLVIMPTYEVTDKLEFVAKYGYMDSGQNQRTQRFGAPPGTGNNRQNVEGYHTLYAGLNYYLCGDNLKVMAGYELASGQLFGTTTDIDSGTWMLGIRTFF